MRMMKCWIGIVVCFLMTNAAVAEFDISEIFVFGDSLSDTGNIFAASGTTFPPSATSPVPGPYGGIPMLHDDVLGLEIAPGRFTDGPNWTEYLADGLALALGHPVARPAARGIGQGPAGTNYAWGGAVTGLTAATYTPTLGPIPPDGTVNGGNPVGAQILTYLTDRLTGQVAAPSESSLFVVWIGSNDFLLSNEDSPRSLARRLELGIETLILSGAQQLLVPNLPSLENTPGVAGTPSFFVAQGLSNNLDRRVERFNRELGKAIDRIEARHPGVIIYESDVFALMSAAIDEVRNGSGSFMGITNVDTPILNESVIFGGQPGAPFNFDILTDPTPLVTSLFWDGVHPTTVAHQILAGQALSAILAPLNSTSGSVVIPEPATAGMTALLVGSLMLKRRR